MNWTVGVCDCHKNYEISYQEFVCHMKGSIPQQSTTAPQPCPVIMTKDMIMFRLVQTRTMFCRSVFHMHACTHALSLSLSLNVHRNIL